MDRRKALKNMGMALGYCVATPTLISIVQSCQEEKVLEWTPDFFSQDQGGALTQLVDIILPKTDTPSASEVQTHLFIDRFANEVMTKEQQDFVKMSMGKFLDKALKDSGKTKVSDLGAGDLEPVLASSLKVNKEDEANNFKLISAYNKAVANGDPAKLDDEVSVFAFANNLRGMTILGYKTSEYIGEQVLAYLPVPGEYVACEDVNELSDGKAWSL